MADAGAPLHSLRKIAAHGSITTTQRYLHPDRQSVADAGELLTRHLSSKGGRTLRVPIAAATAPAALVSGSTLPARGLVMVAVSGLPAEEPAVRPSAVAVALAGCSGVPCDSVGTGANPSCGGPRTR